ALAENPVGETAGGGDDPGTVDGYRATIAARARTAADGGSNRDYAAAASQRETAVAATAADALRQDAGAKVTGGSDAVGIGDGYRPPGAAPPTGAAQPDAPGSAADAKGAGKSSVAAAATDTLRKYSDRAFAGGADGWIDKARARYIDCHVAGRGAA